ncbi:high mobility group nucleosome-binding domain-containing protein 5-like [Papaver somniferum]|uniref:high mobility group nucleosome-binding domain-containing protein 5-like n=1 Tax=Papaver somniferum TaxID=3469 RepID=UPI000E6F9541|nr:high mobility group nucleosome-binding domain-containing protein 5-like [Papaver somniferum]
MDSIRKNVEEPLKVNGCMVYLLMQPGWVKPWSDEKKQVTEEYRKNMQQHSTDALNFIEEKAKKIYEVGLRNVQNDKDAEEEQGETSGKAGDVDDNDDDDSDDDDEEGQEGNRSGKAYDVDDSDKDQEEEGDEDGEDGGAKGGDEEQDEEDGGAKGGDEDHEEEGDEDEEDGGAKGGDEEQDEEDGGAKGGDEEQDEEDGGGKGVDDQQDEEEGGGKGGDIHDDDLQGGKGGDMRGDDTDKEGRKGSDDEGDKSEKRSTPLSKTNEEKDGKDETRQGVEFETAKKPRTSLPETAAYQDATKTAEIDEATIIAAEAVSQLDLKGMLPVEEDLILLTQGEDRQNDHYASIEDLLDNLSESVFIKLEKSCYRMAASDVKEKMATVIHECPSFQLLSKEDPQE